MGWNEAMDIENTRKMFNDEVRFAVTDWGKVTFLRVVNIEVTNSKAKINRMSCAALSSTLTSRTLPCS